jgi:hypothetical protein
MTCTQEQTDLGQRLLEELVQFCRTYGPARSYRAWPRKVLRDYLAWHVREGTLAWVARHGQVAGVGVLFPVNETELRAAHAAGESPFCYRPLDWSCDSVYFADFVARNGELSCLLRAFWDRFPIGRGKKGFAHRHGELVRLDGTRYTNLFGAIERNYGVDKFAEGPRPGQRV